MDQNKVDLVHEIITQRPLDLLEVMAEDALARQQLQHIMARAYIFQGINPKYCQERQFIVTLDNLILLQQYGFQVYLSQNRDLALSYERTISYICLLLNQNIPMKTVLNLTPNQFIDEAQSHMPRRSTLVPATIRTRGEFANHLWQKAPEAFRESFLAQDQRAESFRDLILLGQMFHKLNPETCKDYQKLRKSQNLKKLLKFGKELWEKQMDILDGHSHDKSISYKRVFMDICYLLNHGVLMARVLVLDLEEFHQTVGDLKAKDAEIQTKKLKESQYSTKKDKWDAWDHNENE